MISAIKNLLTVGQQWRLITMLVVSQCLMVSGAAAQQAQGGIHCEPALDWATYSDYLISVDDARVKRTQQALNRLVASGLVKSEVPVDGFLWGKTQQALYQYCQGLSTLPSDDFVVGLIKKLDQQVALMAAVENTINDSAPPDESDPGVKAEPVVKKDTVIKTELITAEQPSIWYQLSEKGLASAKEKAKSAPFKLPDAELLNNLAQVFDVPYLNQGAFLEAVFAKASISIDQYPEFTKELVSAARMKASSQLRDIVLDDDDCGCAQEFSDTVYGFYPYWLSAEIEQVAADSGKQTADSAAATEEKPVEQLPVAVPTINYSVINRIAYYALTVDHNGEIQKPLHWHSEGQLGNFIHKAHRHKTEVDLVIYSNQWMSWSDADQGRAVRSIDRQLSLKAEYKQDGVMAYMPLLNSTTASPDGVTLYFDHYADSSVDERKSMVRFVRQLHTQLAKQDRPLKVNVLLDIETAVLESSDDLFVDLKGLLVKEKDDSPVYIDSLIVFLNEPTTDTKKSLRSKIEREFSGKERMLVLRKVIPVITPNGHEKDPKGVYKQFKDDLIYFNNNFAGIGLWPVPLKLDADSDADAIATAIDAQFSIKNGNGVLHAISEEYPILCRYTCPNRKVLRLVFDGLLILIVGYGVLAIFSRRLRRVYNRHSIYFKLYLFAMVMVFMTSLVCDPFWRERRDSVFVGALLSVAALFIIRKYTRAKQGALP
ncbi:MAG: hypothetical protein L3J89_09740 [Gammaproteobacteria bacterium]|nr:hypothetical protein [Gammaproteobacteria bacterium]